MREPKENIGIGIGIGIAPARPCRLFRRRLNSINATTTATRLRTTCVTSDWPELIIQTPPRTAPIATYTSLMISLAFRTARTTASGEPAGTRS